MKLEIDEKKIFSNKTNVHIVFMCCLGFLF